MKILLVENHVVFAALAARQFLSAHEVATAGSLAIARQLLASRSFDAVLLDFDLDDGKGDVLARELKASRFAGPIVAISSHDRGNAALIAAGATDCCPKLRFKDIEAVLAVAR